MPADADNIQSDFHTPTQSRNRPSPVAEPTWDALLQGLARDVDRVSDRLRGLSQARLAAPAPPHSSRAAAAHATAQTLSDASAGLEARHDPAEPAWRTVPEIGAFASGDLIAVTGHDLVAAAGLAAPYERAWGRHGRRRAQEVVADAADALAALRRLL